MFTLTDIAGSWNFTLENFNEVWAGFLQLFILVTFILIGNILRRVIPFLKKSYIPSSLIGGILLLILNLISQALFSEPIVDPRLMQIVTYHALAIGFIATTLKTTNGIKDKELVKKSTQNGLITGSVYMLQAAFGILTVLIFFWAGKEIFYDAGVILPLSFGQGPGNALTWDINFSDAEFLQGIGANPENAMNTNGSFGLVMASIGFIVASIVGVIYINFYRIKGQIVNNNLDNVDEEIEMVSDQEISKRSANLGIQLGIIGICYLMTFGIMSLLSLNNFTNTLAWGFNFIFGVISATLVKLLINFLRKKNVIKQDVINNRQMNKVSDFAFDLMITAGVAAIDIENVVNYIGIIIALSIVGTIITFLYVRIMTKICFKGYEHDMFLVNFGTLTGTASNGMIFLRESDPTFSRNSANIFVVSQLPAMVAVAPLLLLLNFSAKSLTTCLIAMGIFFALAILYTIIILILNKKKVKEE